MHIFLDERDKELIDGQIDELTNNISELKSDLGNLADIENSKNLFNVSTIREGYYINASTGKPVANESFGYSANIPVESGVSVVITDINHVVFFNNSNAVVGTLLLADKTCVVPSDTSYMIVSVNLTYKNSAQIEYGSTATPYAPYGKKYHIKSNVLYPQNIGIFDIIVDKNGNGNYTTLTEAVLSATSGQRIFIRNGRYANEEVEAWSKDLTIIGESKDGVIICNTLDDYEKPPIEMCSGTLENVTVWAVYNNVSGTKSAYALHCENGNMVDKTFNIRNCSFLSEKNYALGMGLRKGCKVNIVECDFMNSAGGLFFHDSYQSQYAGVQQISIRNCRFTSNQVGRVPLRIQSQHLDGNTVYVEFIGNVVYNTNNPSMPVNYYNDGDVVGEGWNGLINFVGSKLNFGNQASVLNN